MDRLNPSPQNSIPLTPIRFLERTATIYGDCTSIIYNEISYTWSQTHQRCIKLGSSLSSLGITKGDVVSVMAPNTAAMYELQFGVPMSGAVLNNMNIRLDARTISILLRHSESKLIFVDFQFLSLIKEALSLFPQKTMKNPLVIPIEEDERGNPIAASELSYEALIANGDLGFKWVEPESDWSPMVLNYTSGTTSSPKASSIATGGLFAITVDSLIDWSIAKQPIYLWTLPIFHANGWSFPWGIAAVGGTNICLRKFDAAAIYELVSKHGVTHMCGAPVVLNMLANAPQSDKKPLPGPVRILTAGAPPPAAVLLNTEALGFIVSHGYGLTETAGIVVSCAWKPAWDRFPATERALLKARQGVRTIGMAEIDVVDGESGKSVVRDGVTLGEVVMRGGCVMLGYFKDEEATSKCMRDGWFYTGDVGVMHQDGYLEIKDRSKDVIISGGENLSSVEVESILYSHPAVNEAAVVARPDEYWGESPCAFVSLKNEGNGRIPSEKEIVAFCRERLPHYMVPKTVVFKEDLPKTSTGKIQKYLLREMARKLGSSSSSSSPSPSRVSRM